jgi:YD repeat-containing protein
VIKKCGKKSMSRINTKVLFFALLLVTLVSTQVLALTPEQENVCSAPDGFLPPCPIGGGLLPYVTWGSPTSHSNSPSSADPINLVTGNYFYHHQDLFIPGSGLLLTIDRNYNSMDPSSGPFGQGWTFTYNMHLLFDRGGPGNVAVREEDGQVNVFTLILGGSYSSPLSDVDKLTKNTDGSYTLEKKNQVRYLFTTDGKLINIADNNENTINLTYTGNYLTKVTDSTGGDLTLNYSSEGRIGSIADPTGGNSSYTYDENGNLIRFSDSMGGKISYTYDGNHWMTSITNSSGIQLVQNTYDRNGRVISQSNPVDPITNINYDVNNRTTTVTYPSGGEKMYTYDNNGWILSETDDLGYTISYAYNNGNRTRTDMIGEIIQFIHDIYCNIPQIIDSNNNC